jgi:hypothetical protein
VLTRLLFAGVCAIGLAMAPAEARVLVHGLYGPVFHPGFHPFVPRPRVFFGFGFAPVSPYYPYPYAYYPPAAPYQYFGAPYQYYYYPYSVPYGAY